MNRQDQESGVSNIFQTFVDYPRTVITVGLLLIVFASAFLPQLVTDTRPNAFLAEDNPALVYREKVKQQFGLSDPLVIAVVDDGPHGVFTPETLALVQRLTDEISALPNVEASRVLSLATEKDIKGTERGMDIRSFFDPVPETQIEADGLRARINDFPLYLGSLVAKDGNATLIVAELIDELNVDASYQRVMSLVDQAAVTGSVQIHVAGEGAIAGYLGAYIESDARVLIPLAVLTITLIIVLAFRRWSLALLANVIVFAAILISMGIMAANGVAVFVITNALPVILIGIAVADAIHIYSHYFDLQAEQPEQDMKAVIVQAMVEMAPPVTLTTLTTMAGFLGLYMAAYMPPLRYFGLYAALGVFVAWVYSMAFLPAAMSLTKQIIAPHYLRNSERGGSDAFARFMVRVGAFTLHHAWGIVITFSVLAASGFYAASHLLIDEDPIDIFHPSEALYKADKIINKHLDGTNALDVVIETPATEGLFIPSNLKKIEALQAYAQTLPHVGGSVSIVDYLKQMNRAMNGGDIDAYRIPDSEELVAQYFLLYSATADPTDFEEEVDYDYRTANVRINIDTNRYQNYKVVVEKLQRYIEKEFSNEDIHATLSGRINLNYHWIKDLGRSHFLGTGVALILVWGVSALLFGSVQAGFFTLVPVCASVLFVYSAMALLGMHVGVGTSMFAAVAIGLGVDYSIHTLSRLRTLLNHQDINSNDQAFSEFYVTTGRALLFNVLAIACGFGVLIASKISSLYNFGSIVVLAVGSSFIASMTLLPAMIKVFKPRFMVPVEQISNQRRVFFTRLFFIIAVVFASVCMVLSWAATAAELPLADEVVQRVNEVDDGEYVTRTITMKMIDRRGKERVRKAVNYRKYFSSEKRTILFFIEPANVRDTAFLIWDYADQMQTDTHWLYLPAFRKVRRISAADRGDYFFGTDFTYEDMKLDGKLSEEDYNFSFLREEMIDDVLGYWLESVPKSEAIAKELGYSRTELWVDKANWMMGKANFFDLKNQLLKTLRVSDVRKVNGIWSRYQLLMTNHKTGHQTHFLFSDIDYATQVSDELFSSRSLARGQ